MQSLCQPTIDHCSPPEFPVAQWLEHPTSVRRVVGSNPIWNSVLLSTQIIHHCIFIKESKQINLWSEKQKTNFFAYRQLETCTLFLCFNWFIECGEIKYRMLPSFRTKRTLFDYFRRSFKSSSTEEFQK